MSSTIDDLAFDEWAALKKDIHFNKKTPFFKEREIWWASIGQNIGDEQNGKNSLFERPILIIKKFNNQVFIAIPLTGKPKVGKYYFATVSGDRDASVILSQVRLLDAKRLLRKMSIIDEDNFKKIKQACAKITLK